MRYKWLNLTDSLKHLKYVVNEKKRDLNSNLSKTWITSLNPAILNMKIWPKHGTFIHSKSVKNKLAIATQWYEEFTGLDEVKAAQNRVLEAEFKFVEAQTTRRETNAKLADIQNSLREVYAELDKTKRGDEQFVSLINKEHTILKEERILLSAFKRYEQEERENFSILSSALKDSHEKERMQSEKTKYWSIIGSIIGTIIGILGSAITNKFRTQEICGIINDAISQHHSIDPKLVLELQQILPKLNQKYEPLESKFINKTQENIMLQQQQQQQISIGLSLAALATVVIIFRSLTGS